MKALVLAAGLGERVRPLTEKIPKPMLEVGGRPLIHYPLRMLKRAGITEVAINVHYLAGEIQKGLKNGASLGINIIYSPEPTLSGTGGPLNALRNYFGVETFVLANSDSIVDLDLSAMIAFHRDRGGLATIALYPTGQIETYGEIRIDGDSRIRRMRLVKTREPLSFDEYPREFNEAAAAYPGSYMYCGVTILEPAVFDLMPKAPPWGLMTGLLAPMVAKGLPLFGFVHRGYFRTVDDVASYEALRHEFESSPPTLRNLGI